MTASENVRNRRGKIRARPAGRSRAADEGDVATLARSSKLYEFGRTVSSAARAEEVLVGQLRHKLGDEPTHPRFIVTVQGVGYRLATHPR